MSPGLRFAQTRTIRWVQIYSPGRNKAHLINIRKNMTRKISLIILLLYSISVYGEEIYFKPYIRYHLPLITQNAPVYFNILSYSPNALRLNNQISSTIENFSLAQGFKYGGTLGYTFNDVLGVELSSDYFSTDKTFISNNSYMNGILNWKLNSWNFIPTFTFSRKYLKSSVIGKIGFITGITGLDKSIRTESTTPLSYRFDKNTSIGYTFSIEYNYRLSDKLALAAECGIENTYYTPTKAELTGYFNQNNPVDYYSTYIRTIKYENNIRNLHNDTYNYNSSTIYLPDQNSPQMRIKETLIMNSLFLGISLKYYIFKK